MKGETAERIVIGIAAVTALAGIYNVVTLPRGESDGLFGTIRRAQETFEWAASSSAVNSLTFVLVAVALVLLATNAEFEG